LSRQGDQLIQVDDEFTIILLPVKAEAVRLLKVAEKNKHLNKKSTGKGFSKMHCAL
jgi:sRNA-binding carbon storage regulator CsrA